ncbi:MAG: hypothetical protein ACTHJR_14090 [Sphingomonas sp.]|uniref:hypothetical protein n=1 Tax=Sphingomonas sp. TaxID=28214 RepID=UPI003F7FDC0C
MSSGTERLRAAMDFLRQASAADVAGLPARVDYDALAERAAARGFETDAAAMAEAFRILVRMRLAHGGRASVARQKTATGQPWLRR